MNRGEELVKRYPKLESERENVEKSIAAIVQCFQRGGKLLACGNGGSAADADHMAGELLKGFEKKRPLSEALRREIDFQYGGSVFSDSLQMGLPVINLTTHTALQTAFANDCDYTSVFAQLVLAYGREGDVLMGISTSGNSENVLRAVAVAKARGIMTIGLTGNTGGKLRQMADISICVPENCTYRVQELHLPIYHAICLAVEDAFYEV